MEYLSQKLSDEQMMDLALRLGRRGAGNTDENPAVGCVIARHDENGTKILGRGWTQPGGRPHAERVALAEAGDAAKGATAYVSLEPCSHFGKSPPCASGLIEAGIAEVICAHDDPDPRVAGRGFAMLKERGVTCRSGLLESVAHRDLSGFLSRIVRRRPWVQAKMAFSPDGKIGKTGIGNHPITGAMAKAKTYLLRAMADAILIGAETAIVDDPSLTVRLEGMEELSPVRVVLDSKGRLPLSNSLVQTAKEVPVWIFTTGAISAEKALTLEARGCRVFLVDADAHGRLSLSHVLETLALEGINKLFAECGAALGEALLSGGHVDEFYLYQGDALVGSDGLSALGGAPEKSLEDAGFVHESTETMGKDTLQVYIRPQSLEELNGRM